MPDGFVTVALEIKCGGVDVAGGYEYLCNLDKDALEKNGYCGIIVSN